MRCCSPKTHEICAISSSKLSILDCRNFEKGQKVSKKKLAAAGSILVDELNRWIQIGPQKHIILGAISWGTSTHGGCRRRILAKRKIAQMLSVFSSSAGRFFLMWQWEIPKKHGAVNAEFEIWNFPLPHLTTHGAQLHFQEY